MSNTRKPLSNGFILDGYRIEKVIGGGGFSFVYLAYHIRTKAKVVIKEYFPHDLVERIPGGRVEPIASENLTQFRQGLKRFFSEGMALSKLKHPNIVHVSNFFRANNTVVMVMDFKQGRDLRWFVKRTKGRLGEKFLLAVFPRILEGLRELHAMEFLHLDIKPANILLSAGGEPLLLDFGAVQHLKPGERYSGVQTLTHGYAPPEQYDRGPMGPWSDLYSLGMTMRTCITGKHPPTVLERRERDTVMPVSKTHSRKYGAHILEAIDWAGELDHRLRPQDTDALLHMLTSEPRSKHNNGLRGWWS